MSKWVKMLFTYVALYLIEDNDWIALSACLLNVGNSVPRYSYLALIQPRFPSPSTEGLRPIQSGWATHLLRVVVSNQSSHLRAPRLRPIVRISPSHSFRVRRPQSCLLATLRPHSMVEMMASVRSHCMKIKLGPKLIIRWRNGSRVPSRRFTLFSFASTILKITYVK
jgi:hypothetical protein